MERMLFNWKQLAELVLKTSAMPSVRNNDLAEISRAVKR